MGRLFTSQKIYETDVLQRPKSGVVQFRAQVTGLIRTLQIWGGAPLGQNYFNFLIDGVPKFSGENRLVLSASGTVERGGLAFAVQKGELLRFDLEVPSQAGVSAPVYFQVITEEAD